MLKRFFYNQEAMRYMKNSAWMLAEYALKVISAFFVSVYVARYLGPEQFGELSYALAIVAIFMVISRLGMESILVRDLANYPEQRQAYMSTAFGLMLMAAIAAILTLGGLVYFFESESQTQLYIWIISTGIVFQTLLVVDFNFQAQVKAKYSSLAKSIALTFSAISKLVLVWVNAELIYFAAFYAIDHAVIGLIMLFMHCKKKQPLFFTCFNKKLIRPLLTSAWPMVLSAIAATLYMRVDQVMIKNMLGAHDLGLYAAAVKIYEGWMIVPYVISISLLPAIVELKASSNDKYEKSMALLFSILFWTSVVVALLATFMGKQIFILTFGPEYVGSASILGVVMWAAIFSALGSVTARYLTVEGMEKKIATRTFIGLILNVLLNFILIPNLGMQGAAISTLITLFIANYAINYLDEGLSQLVGICNSSMTLKWWWNEK